MGMKRILLGLILVAAIGFSSSQVGAFQIAVPSLFSTIQEAIDSVPEGTTILVQAGTYHENLRITRSVELVGAAGAHLIGDGERPIIAIEGANDVLIEGFRFTNGRPAIAVRDSDEVVIRKNVFIENLQSAISVRNSSVDINSNSISLTVNGESAGVFISNSSDRSHITNNLISENFGQGISIRSSEVELMNNRVLNNGGVGISISRESDASMLGNDVAHNHGAGLLLTSDSKAHIEFNLFQYTEEMNGRGHGIVLRSNASAEFVSNIILSNSGSGVQLMEGTEAEFYWNIVEANGSHGYWIGEGAFTEINGNYIMKNSGCGVWAEAGSHLNEVFNLFEENEAGALC